MPIVEIKRVGKTRIANKNKNVKIYHSDKSKWIYKYDKKNHTQHSYTTNIKLS